MIITLLLHSTWIAAFNFVNCINSNKPCEMQRYNAANEYCMYTKTCTIHPMHNTEFEMGTGDELHQNEVGRASTRTFGFPFTRCLFIAVFRSSSGEKILYFNFPKSEDLRKKWLVAIRRDPGDDFVLRENTKVCSRHFKQTDPKKSLNGVVNPKKGSVPCKFPWSPNSPRKRKAPKERSSLPTKGARVDLEIEESPEHETEELKSDEDYLREELHALKAENDAMKERMSESNPYRPRFDATHHQFPTRILYYA